MHSLHVQQPRDPNSVSGCFAKPESLLKHAKQQTTHLSASLILQEESRYIEEKTKTSVTNAIV